MEFRAELYGSGRLAHSLWYGLTYDGWRASAALGKPGGVAFGAGILEGILDLWSDEDAPADP